jgi:tryptophanase
MAQDHNDIYTIVDRLRVLEEGLDKNQRSVNQLSATFKPKTVAVLTAKKDPKNPMAGKLVGSDESVENDKPVLEADMSEDVLDKVKKSFTDFIKSVEDKIEDSDIKEKKKGDSDLKAKDKQDLDLVSKQKEIDEDDTELGAALSGVIPAEQPAGEPGVSMKESAPVKTVTNECGIWEMHGNERDGFEIRRAGRCLPSRFKNLDEAQMALEMFAHHKRKQDESQDYMEER